MHTANGLPRELSVLRATFVVFGFCAATAIASPAQTLTTLANFAGSNGATPLSSLIQAADGSFYGTTELGGSSSNNCVEGCGTVFKITQQNGAWILTTLHSFDYYTDGAFPVGWLVQAADGNLYGTTSGGSSSAGTIFKISPNSPYTLSTIYNFCSQLNCADGTNPSAGLIQATDGSFYGTTAGGGNGYGTVFKFAQQNGIWTLTTLHSFDFTDGSQPLAPLVQATDGNFYGITTYGGNNFGPNCNPSGCGTVFKMTPEGALTTLHLFCQGNCTDGLSPYHAGLVQATDGSLYGTTYLGGGSNGNGDGTVFQITTGGTLTTLHTFHFTDGKEPQAGLIQATDGNLYGTTAYAGPNGGAGTVFEITPAGTLNVLYTFCSQNNCLDGESPQAGLVQGTDGNFYGTTTSGGADGYGTVFSLTPLTLISTTTALNSAPNPSNLGESVTMTATVTAQNGSLPTGTVNFSSNGVSIGSAALNSSGVAVLELFRADRRHRQPGGDVSGLEHAGSQHLQHRDAGSQSRG